MATGISRATLPQEFYDITSAMLLLQPEPQYLHGLLLKGALQAGLDTPAEVGLPIAGRLFGGENAPYGKAEDGRLVLADPVFSEAVTYVPELNDKGIGHTVRINRPKYTNSTYTQASRRVPVGTTISTTAINVSSEQVPITLDRFAGPYDSTASSVAPYAIERFDASKSIHALAAIVGRHMQRDYDRWLDAVGVALFDLGSTTIRPTGMTTDNTSAVAGDYPMDLATLMATETQLVTANIPTFPNGKYAMVLHQRQIEQLARDPEAQRLTVFEPPTNPLLKTAYSRTVGAFSIFRSTTLTTASNTNSITIYYGQAFGPGAVGLGMGRMPEVVPHTSDNYGETALLIWLTYMGFTLLDDRFTVGIHTS